MPTDSQTIHTRHDWQVPFRRRSRWFLWLVVIWLVVLVVQLVSIMLVKRDDYLSRFRGPSWRLGILPALRGRILDRHGLPLAWSTRYYALAYQVPIDAELQRRDLIDLSNLIGIAPADLRDRVRQAAGGSLVIRRQLTAEEVLTLGQARHPRLHVVTQYERHQAGLPGGLRRSVGNTRQVGQVEVGVSGWEATYDGTLRGTDGKYKVMVDKNGNWIAETWQELVPPSPGRDVYLQLDLREIER